MPPTRKAAPLPRAKRGGAAPAKDMAPPELTPSPDQPRPAPMPGTPIAPRQLEQLKRRTRGSAPPTPAQDEDADD